MIVGRRRTRARGAAPAPAAPRPPHRLQLDPVACDGHGLCAAAAPDLVTLDRWGFPVVRPDVERGTLAQARAAAAACPALALRLSRRNQET